MSSAITTKQSAALASVDLTAEQIQILKDTVARGATDAELAFFGQVCNRLQLDPFARQICLVKRWDNQLGREVATPQTTIDGFRLIAERTGKYRGQEDYEWCGPDGVWMPLWLDPKNPPYAARATVIREDFVKPIRAVARYKSYAQRKRDGSVTDMWWRMDDNQLAKCAEALALRKAFPQDLSGLYTDDEMRAAENQDVEQAEVVEVQRAEAPKAQRLPTVDELREAIKAAKSLEDLLDVGAQCERLSPKQQEQLAPLFQLRRGELEQAPASSLPPAEKRETVKNEPEPEKEPAKKKRGATLTAREASLLQPVLDRIKAARNGDDLAKITGDAEKLPNAARAQARTAWAQRSNELAAAERHDKAARDAADREFKGEPPHNPQTGELLPEKKSQPPGEQKPAGYDDW